MSKEHKKLSTLEEQAEAVKLANSEAQLELVKKLIQLQPPLTELYIAAIHLHIKCFLAAEEWRNYCINFFFPKK